LAKLHRLSGVDEALDDLTSDAKAQIALNACGDDTREGPLTWGGRLHRSDADKRRLQAWVCLGGIARAQPHTKERNGNAAAQDSDELAHVRAPLTRETELATKAFVDHACWHEAANYAQQLRLGPGGVSQLEIALDRPEDRLRDALRRRSQLELAGECRRSSA
jgi:hypothetical protein